MADITTNLLPKSATSQEARDELNAKTSALPSLKETVQNAGDALTGESDVAGDVKKARLRPEVLKNVKSKALFLADIALVEIRQAEVLTLPEGQLFAQW